jgi:hypothetical protein
MTEKTKYTYLKYKRKSYRLWDKLDIGDRDCPKCGIKSEHLKRIDVQLGFFGNLVTCFAVCDNCRHHFAWQDDNLKKAEKLMQNERLWEKANLDE